MSLKIHATRQRCPLSSRSVFTLLLIALATQLSGAEPPVPENPDWKVVAQTIGTAGELKEDVYTITLPRTDLDVSIEGMAIPPAAGLAHRFHFFKCPCGKTIVVGEFCVPEYEANDVIDALRTGAVIRVGSATNLFVGDKPKMMAVRFQGEGEPAQLAKLVKEALRWTGEARNRKAPVEK